MNIGASGARLWGVRLLPRKPKYNEVSCPKCREPIGVDASICPHCRTEFSEQEVAERKRSQKFGVGAGCLTLLALVLMIGWCTSDGDDTAPETVALESDFAVPETLAIVPVEPENDNLTAPQRNAVRSARQYIQMTGFSRRGLIDQLSSEYGDGYDQADATVAVDSLGIDWNEQAVRSAQKYLEMTGFSCDGLVDQLSSDAGDQFTIEQGRHGAQQAGAC